VFARFHGVLVEETDRAVLEEHWNNFVEAWFPGGPDSPNLLFMRMNLGDASIWAGELGLIGTAKMALGMDVTNDVKGGYTDTKL
jgi:general stress protein 26